MDLEHRAEQLLGHRRAFDVPPRAAGAPRGGPRRVLVRLRRLPEGEIALVFLQVARLLGDHVLELRARELPVVGVGGDAKVDVAPRLVREPAFDQLLDQRDDLRNRLAGERLVVGAAQAEVVGVVEVPLRGCGRQLLASDPPLLGRLVDLVVDVRDVLDECHVVALVLEPALQPEEDDVRPRVSNVDPLIDGRPAHVRADRARRRRQLFLPAREGVVEEHGSCGYSGSRGLRAPFLCALYRRRNTTTRVNRSHSRAFTAGPCGLPGSSRPRATPPRTGPLLSSP